MTDLSEATYVFGDDGTAYAMVDETVIASHHDVEQLEVLVEVEKREASRKPAPKTKTASTRKSSTHVVTPNGLTGEVLGRTPSLWGDTVTVRFANNQIQTLPCHSVEPADEEFTHIAKAESDNLNERLAKTPTGTLASLTERQVELTEIVREARAKLSTGQPYDEERRLDDIVIAAEREKREVSDAIAYLEAEAQKQTSYNPPSPQVVEQASMGRSASNWLDAVYDEMVHTAESQDFDKLLGEGPELFVNDLPDGVVADTGDTRTKATKYIRSRVAGIQNTDLVQKYVDTFLDRVEAARVASWKQRRDAMRTDTEEKTAKTASLNDVPVEAIFGV